MPLSSPRGCEVQVTAWLLVPPAWLPVGCWSLCHEAPKDGIISAGCRGRCIGRDAPYCSAPASAFAPCILMKPRGQGQQTSHRCPGKSSPLSCLLHCQVPARQNLSTTVDVNPAVGAARACSLAGHGCHRAALGMTKG